MEWIDIKDWLLNKGPLRSSKKCLHCNKGAIWVAADPELPVYCEDHAPWREEDGVD